MKCNPMDFLAFLAPAAIVLAVFAIPARLIRRRAGFSAEHDVGAANHVAPRVIGNAQVAYGCGVAALAPLFAWGAGGRFAAAIGYALAVGCGVLITAVLRRPITELLAGERDRGATVPALVSRRHGSDPAVRAVAAALSVAALAGFLVCEMLALATVLAPLLNGSAAVSALTVTAVLAVTTSCVLASRPSAPLHAAQLLLGVIYFGLFAATAVLVYLQLSELGSVPAAGRFAIALMASCCAVVVALRRVRYVDTGVIAPAADPSIKPAFKSAKRPPRLARAASRLGKILNVLIAVAAGVAIGFAAVELQAAGIATVLGDGARLLADTPLPGLAALALVLRALLHPVVDAVNWQTLSAFATLHDGHDLQLKDRHRGRAFRRLVAGGAVEVAMMVLLTALFAAVAGLGAAPQDGEPNVLQGLAARLVAQDNAVAVTAVWLLALALCALAVATMGALLAALHGTLRHDIVPLLRPGATPAALESGTAVAVAAASAAAAAAFWVGAAGGITLASHGFLAAVFTASALQLALAPLVLAAVAGRRRSMAGAGKASLTPRWAMAVMAAGAAAGTGAVCAFAITGAESWLWAAVPASLAAGAAVHGLGRLWPVLRGGHAAGRKTAGLAPR